MDGRRLARSSVVAAIVSAGFFGILTAVLAFVGPTLLNTAVLLAAFCVVAALLRRRIRRFAVFHLLTEYGLLPRRWGDDAVTRS